jgi:hypothetical protein
MTGNSEVISSSVGLAPNALALIEPINSRMDGKQEVIRTRPDGLSSGPDLGQIRRSSRYWQAKLEEANGAIRAPGTRFAFSFRCDYRFPEQLQFVARDRS